MHSLFSPNNALYFLPRTLMTHQTKLPDAMPEIASPTLLIVADAHHCRFIAVGGHAIAEEEELQAKELLPHEDKDSQADENRLRDFAVMIVTRAELLISQQNIEAVYLSGPSRLLSDIKKHLSLTVSKVLQSTIDGTFIKESPLDILARFRPDLEASVQKLHEQENYSAKKHLPN